MIKITPTPDGSNTLYVPSTDEHYHCTNGAIQESRHVFFENGYRQCSSNPVRIFITYSARGQLKRDLAKLGFEVFHPDGPPGTRQITRAVKMI
ncbi:MAG: hypothetical protein K9J25_08205 [Bacteroidales bacterium]|nr:hypothetical protein [Bacteroidales bacterium]